MRKNIFILGLDDFYREEVEAVLHPEEYAFHGLFELDEVTGIERVQFDALLEKGQNQLDAFDGSVDALVIHWPFPSTALKAILCRERGLRSASLEAVLKCGHKYWSRLEQARHVPEATPGFCKVDPFEEDPKRQIQLDYPFWLKPVKSYSSKLGFHINNSNDFHMAIEKIRERLPFFARPFDEALAHAEIPPEMEGVGGGYCVAEEFVKGINVAPEGHVFEGDVRIHGIVNMVQEPGKDSYGWCEYPSQVPQQVQHRMIEITKRLMKGIGYDNDCFNIEFLWDEDTDNLSIIEVNPRISRAHSNLFHQVDGESNHKIAVHIALGQEPHFEYGQGPYNIAADFWWRVYEDRFVEAVPSQAEIDRVKQKFPGTRVRIYPEAGKRVSDVPNSDSYSYVIADVMLGAEDRDHMIAHYREAQNILTFKFRPV